MREYRIDMSPYGISRYAYEELKAFCLQYPEKRAKADALAGLSGKPLSGMPPNGGGLSTVERAVERREKYMTDCDVIDRAASEADGGRFQKALILHVCYRVPYARIDTAILPTSRRNAFFRAKREFYFLLWQKKYGI